MSEEKQKRRFNKKGCLTLLLLFFFIFMGLNLCIISSRVMAPSYADEAYLIGYYGAVIFFNCIVTLMIVGGIVVVRKLFKKIR
jgi:hypothetical protein